MKGTLCQVSGFNEAWAGSPTRVLIWCRSGIISTLSCLTNRAVGGLVSLMVNLSISKLTVSVVVLSISVNLKKELLCLM